MTASELEVIKADLLTAKMIMQDSSGGANNPFMTNLAAYHSGQAIEKCLKSVIRDYGHLDEDLALSHSIEKLVLKAELCQQGFVQSHKYIAQNADSLSKFNGLRYGIKSISDKDVRNIYFCARDFHKELEQRYLNLNSPDKRVYREEAKRQYNQLNHIGFNGR